MLSWILYTPSALFIILYTLFFSIIRMILLGISAFYLDISTFYLDITIFDTLLFIERIFSASSSMYLLLHRVLPEMTRLDD